MTVLLFGISILRAPAGSSFLPGSLTTRRARTASRCRSSSRSRLTAETRSSTASDRFDPSCRSCPRGSCPFGSCSCGSCPRGSCPRGSCSRCPDQTTKNTSKTDFEVKFRRSRKGCETRLEMLRDFPQICISIIFYLKEKN